jgi:hypothetical protein
VAESIWERLAERVGYGLGFMMYGPSAALEHRARRRMRTTMLDFWREAQPIKLGAPRPLVRRAVTLESDAGPLSGQVELDLATRRVTLALPLERLPSYVDARVGKSLATLSAMLLQMGEPLATSGAFRIDSTTLDREAAEALVQAVADGPLDRLEAVEIRVKSDTCEIFAVAPILSEEWAAIRDGSVGVVQWLRARWRSSYR